MMELRQIRHFIAVAEHENFTRAALSMHIVQSALSTSIKQLEEELGTPLFIRSTRKVRLTMAGKVFLHYARTIGHYVDKAVQEVDAIVSLKTGTLSIGTVQSVPPFIDLPELLETFIRKFPDFEVKLCQGSSERLNEKIQNQQISLAIMPVEEVSDRLASRIIACDEMVLAFAHDFPDLPAEGETIAMEALAGLSFIDFESGQGTRKVNDGCFALRGLSRKITFEVSDLDTLLSLLERKMGVALLPEEVVLARGDKLTRRKISNADLCWELAVVWLSDSPGSLKVHDRPVQEFLDILGPAEEEA
ncbi:LysR family transcriptional regulator [Cedecea sp. NFIX57]|uniref:LysR family transcriptional regulator n=1 Tax=Cedecea sp. NFIX57 TaxID=1566286 RepID=UPI00111C3F30|nr:LysR family transcriptional regulator [Cedecea sp. NFIX57]